MKRLFVVATLVLFSGVSNMAVAQSSDVGGFIALGAAVTPEYEGSEDYQGVPLLVGRAHSKSEGYYIELQGTTGRANLIPKSIGAIGKALSLEAGPSINYRFERSDVENVRVGNLRDVDAALEVGGFVALSQMGVFGERDSLTGRVEMMGDTSDAHDGHLVSLSMSYAKPINKKWRIGLGVDSTYASDKFADTYFSVDPDNAARSGLAVYKAEGGFKDVGFNASAMYSFNQNWGVMTRARFSHLLGDAVDSPLVKDEGSDNQFFGGVAVSYRF